MMKGNRMIRTYLEHLTMEELTERLAKIEEMGKATRARFDAGYRGEVKVALINLDPDHDYEVRAGDRIAQLVILPVPPVAFVPTGMNAGVWI